MIKIIISSLLAFVILIFTATAEAQQTGKIFRIGFLDRTTASGSALLLDAFQQEFSELGWIERKSITIEYRFAEGNTEPLPQLAAELARLKVYLIVSMESDPTFAAKSATTNIPHCHDELSDPVGAGLVWRRPGGNVTGFSSLTIGVSRVALDMIAKNSGVRR